MKGIPEPLLAFIPSMAYGRRHVRESKERKKKEKLKEILSEIEEV